MGMRPASSKRLGRGRVLARDQGRRGESRLPLADAVGQGLRFALRLMRRNPGNKKGGDSKANWGRAAASQSVSQ
jgi:hypothetical protein